MAHDRDVAGIRCGHVLDVLPDYIDDTLDPATRTRLEAHLRGCDWCEHFGGSYASLVTTLRSELTRTEEPGEAVRYRLLKRLGLDYRTSES